MGSQKHCHIDLGLSILCSKEYRLPPGERRTYKEIAAYCNCSRQRIEQIERRGLRKLRFRLKQELGKDYNYESKK